MHWDVLLDDTSRTTALQEGSVQVMENVPDANADQLTAAGATVEYIQGFNQAFLMFNTQKAPFNDKRVRQAFFYAIDVDKLISNALNGHAAKVTSFLPKDHKNYHEPPRSTPTTRTRPPRSSRKPAPRARPLSLWSTTTG